MIDQTADAKVMLTCDFKASPNCKVAWLGSKRLRNRTKAANSGKIICMPCSRRLKGTGRNNPNAQYALDDNFFADIDTEAKAYLLGWIASDGHVGKGTITIAIKDNDITCLERLRDAISADLPIKWRNGLVSLSINSKTIIADVCRWLDISTGKKSDVVNFPHALSADMKWHFLRGLFDGDGTICSAESAETKRLSRGGWPEPRCGIASNSKRMREGVAEFCGVPCYMGTSSIDWRGANALQLLSMLYGGATLYLSRKRDRYFDWSTWVPGLMGRCYVGSIPDIRWIKAHHAAVPPRKYSATDTGFDLHVIEKEKTFGRVEMYRTGLRIAPPHGWYFDLVARSSIVKTGYMLANGIGVIDSAFAGEVMVPLIKVDPNAPDLPLPARIVQIVPRPIIMFDVVEVDELTPTVRGEGGFGSTGL